MISKQNERVKKKNVKDACLIMNVYIVYTTLMDIIVA